MTNHELCEPSKYAKPTSQLDAIESGQMRSQVSKFLTLYCLLILFDVVLKASIFFLIIFHVGLA